MTGSERGDPGIDHLAGQRPAAGGPADPAGTSNPETRRPLRILFVAYHYPPDPAVGAVRAGRVVEALRAAGHAVDVVTVRTRDLRAPDEPHTHRVLRLPNAREIALWLRNGVRRLLPGRETSRESQNSGGYATPADVPQWKRFLLAMALMPDDQQGFVLPATLKSLRLAWRGVDVLYTSGPPHSAQVVGLAVHALSRVHWIAEFRDPWTDNAVQPRYASSQKAFAMKRGLERRCLAAADQVVTVTEAVADLFRSKMGADPAPVHVVRNGIEAIEGSAPERAGRKRIVYLGSLYHRRDPRPFLRAVAALRHSERIDGALPMIDFYGHCRWFHDVDIAQEADRLGIGDMFGIHDPVPHARAAQLAVESDLLLIFAQEQPLQVPQKLYEYLATGKPILAFADRDGETAAMLNQLGGHFVADAGSGPVEDIVLRALNAAGAPPATVHPELLREWSAAAQMQHLVGIVERSSVRSPAHRIRPS